MTQFEREKQSIEKEIEKLVARLERNEKALAKKAAAAEKLNATEFNEKWNEVIEGTIYRKPEHVKPYGAWFDYKIAKSNVEETKEAIARQQARLEKLAPQIAKVEADKADTARINDIESRFVIKTAEEAKADYEKWLAQFKAECLKDGVVIEQASHHVVTGTTKSGKHFFLYINSGVTERSFHCYSLTIDGETIFTSGEFATAYKIIRR